MRDCLTKLGFESGVEIHVDCIDIQRKPWTICPRKAKKREGTTDDSDSVWSIRCDSAIPTMLYFFESPLDKFHGAATSEKLR